MNELYDIRQRSNFLLRCGYSTQQVVKRVSREFFSCVYAVGNKIYCSWYTLTEKGEQVERVRQVA